VEIIAQGCQPASIPTGDAMESRLGCANPAAREFRRVRDVLPSANRSSQAGLLHATTIRNVIKLPFIG
jgi:hypothetical protein